ncbi:MAG: hypothetical protein OEQ12_00400 [Nitrosopumilus sp.]|nr:hypothetical protein [Nitrosopumilus sp.]
MSIITQRKKTPLRDLKIKLSYIPKYFDSLHASIYPRYNLGSFNSPIGRNTVVKAAENEENRSKFLGFLIGFLFVPVGMDMIFQNSQNWLGWSLVIFGGISAWSSGAILYDKIKGNSKENQKLKFQVRDLEKRLAKLENQNR